MRSSTFGSHSKAKASVTKCSLQYTWGRVHVDCGGDSDRLDEAQHEGRGIFDQKMAKMANRRWCSELFNYDENVGGDDRDGVGGDGDQNQDKPVKLLGQGWGGEGAPAPPILILTDLISNGFQTDFFVGYFVFHSFRFSIFVETYFSIRYLIMDISEGAFSKS